jgi:hypothetical protein
MAKRRRRRLKTNPAPAPADPLQEIMQELIGNLKNTAIRGIQAVFHGPSSTLSGWQETPTKLPAPPQRDEPEIKEAQVISIRTSK